MLHTPNRDIRGRGFCGPTAMAAVTGLPMSLIQDAVREVSGLMFTAAGAAHPIMGMRNEWLLDAMALLGWRVTESAERWSRLPRIGEKRMMAPYRLGEFCAEHGHGGPFIVNVTGHYIAVAHGEICDTYTNIPLDIASYRRRMERWVRRWWKFEAQ